jgi:hypothetical protein
MYHSLLYSLTLALTLTHTLTHSLELPLEFDAKRHVSKNYVLYSDTPHCAHKVSERVCV